MRQTKTAALCVLALVLYSCGGLQVPSGIPAAPTPPQVKVANVCDLGGHAASLASDTLIALWDAKKIDAGTFNAARTYIKTANAVFRDVARETASVDSWPVMRAKIGAIAARAAVSVAVNDPTLQAQLDSIVASVQQIMGVQ